MLFIVTLQFDEKARMRYDSSIDWNTQTATTTTDAGK